MSATSATAELRFARRNRWAFFSDYVLFGLGLTIMNASTTLPAFVARLTDSKVLIGAVGAIWIGGWLLPQIVAANSLTGRRLKRPHLIGASWLGRPFFWLFAAFLVLGGARNPGLTVAVFLIGLTIYVVSDAYAALAYFDLFGKAMPAHERGRILGLGQAVLGMLAIGAGWLVQRLLGNAGLPFPLDYAALFAFGGLCFMGALAADYAIVETAGEAQAVGVPWKEYLPKLRAFFRNDPAFARVNVVRLLAGLHGLAMPFYVIYATRVAGLPESSVGVFLTAQTVGSALAGLGALAAKLSSQRIVQISAGVEVVTAGLALMMALGGTAAGLTWVFPIIFGLMGILEGAIALGYFNYLMDVAPDADRPTYIGLHNTLAGVLVVMPVLGGWILEHTSYTVLFAITAAGVAPALLLSLSLPKPTHKAQAE
jgi:Major Facilitator Superfamily